MSKRTSVEAILERQARFRDLRERLEAERGSRRARPAQGPFVSVSRQLGSGGTELARRLGHELGWEVYDHEILRTIAANTHTREAVISQMDERAIGPLQDYLRRLLSSEVPGQQPIVEETMKVIWGLARTGNAVIVGRGANWFLPREFGVRVRCVAPRDVRVERVAAELGLTRDKAADAIDGDDRGRATFVQQVFGRDIEDPLGYDLILNLDGLALDTATEIVVAALRSRLGQASFRPR